MLHFLIWIVLLPFKVLWKVLKCFMVIGGVILAIKEPLSFIIVVLIFILIELKNIKEDKL